MTDTLRELIELCEHYKKVSTECLNTMRAARTYASLNESIIETDSYILILRDRCEDLNTRLKEEINNINELTEGDMLDITLGYNNLGRAILRLDKADRIFMYIRSALSGEEKVKSAKKTTRVNMVGKTVNKVKADINDNISLVTKLG